MFQPPESPASALVLVSIGNSVVCLSVRLTDQIAAHGVHSVVGLGLELSLLPVRSLTNLDVLESEDPAVGRPHDTNE